MRWSVPRLWDGEPAFIVGGGPSVLGQNLELLRGRRVIAINSSFASVPFADMLFFGDERWWTYANRAAAPIKAAAFAGTIVTTCSVKHPRVNRLRNSKPPKPARHRPLLPLTLSDDPSAVPVRRTSFTGAINVVVLAGAAPLVLLGADGQRGADGRCHHHDPHPPALVPTQGCWDQHRAELAQLDVGLKQRGIAVINASPGSAWELWPVMTLEEAIVRVDRQRLAA